MTARHAAPGATDREGGLPTGPLDVVIARTGDELLATLSRVLGQVPGAANAGPQALATRLGIDKVLASRLLKALRAGDPLAVVNRAPGPEPLRRVLDAAESLGVAEATLSPAREAVDRFERLIRDEIGDRSSLDAILAAWVPDARREFELRRKQAASKATSQLKGVFADVLFAAVFLAPSQTDPSMLDVVWINGLQGVRRLTPGAAIKFATRRLTPSPGGSERKPLTLTGDPVEHVDGLLLPEFCSSPTPKLTVHHAGEVVHYTLAGDDFGPGSGVDMVMGELNRAELKRGPRPNGRKMYVFAEVSQPARLMHFDAFFHASVAPRATPALLLYDTAFEGVVDPNNPARDIDRLDMLETIQPLPRGVESARTADVKRYAELLHRACDMLGWDPSSFIGARCRIDYPIYGAQATMTLDPPPYP
jgi:hypothetical protein